MYRKYLESIILVFVMLGVFLLMWIMNGGEFFRSANFQSMAFQLPELGILSLAMMVTILTAGINLSIIASANISGIVAAIILTQLIKPEKIGRASCRERV